MTLRTPHVVLGFFHQTSIYSGFSPSFPTFQSSFQVERPRLPLQQRGSLPQAPRRQRRQRPWGQGVGIYWNCIIWGGSINGRSISWKIQLKWMICGYLYFRKPPYNSWICIYIYILYIYIYIIHWYYVCGCPYPKNKWYPPLGPPFIWNTPQKAW